MGAAGEPTGHRNGSRAAARRASGPRDLGTQRDHSRNRPATLGEPYAGAKSLGETALSQLPMVQALNGQVSKVKHPKLSRLTTRSVDRHVVTVL